MVPTPEDDDSLWSYFHRKTAVAALTAAVPKGIVLIFDQFEEIWRLSRLDPEQGRAQWQLWANLRQLIEAQIPEELRTRIEVDPDVLREYDLDAAVPTVILSLREDYLAQFETHLGEIPTLRWAGRLRLTRLSGQEAIQAIRRPAPEVFSERTAERLVRMLARAPEEAPLDTCEVDPPLLSLMCHELNSMRQRLGMDTVDPSLIGEANHTSVLENFYRQALADMPDQVSQWIEEQLITVSGLRNTVPYDNALADLASRRC